MLPWQELDRVKEPSGSELSLHRRGDEYVIRVDRQDLMGSRMHGSEEELARRGCAHLANVRGARVLIGGLGMGFTVRAALDVLGKDAQVDVAELVPAVVRWNREVFGQLAKHPLDDPRVRVIEADVREVLRDAPGRYDAVLLDVDNGPAAFTSKGNSGLYGMRGIEQAARALRPRGVYGVWSAFEDPGFTARLERMGFSVRVERVLARGHKGSRHVVWLATRGRPASSPRPSGQRAASAGPRRPRR